MEPQPNQNQQQNEEGGGKNNNSSNGSGYLCRQSSTRWTPTSEQIRILKELYYNNGVRSPSAEQIQRISARLRQYGKIEGKNVFYWFQNHKARERQKKRLVTTTNTNNTSDHHHHQYLPNFNPRAHTHLLHSGAWRSSEYPNITPGVSSSSPSSSSGVLGVCQVGNYGYGSVAMEKSFRDCSISPRDHHHSSTGGSVGPSFGWIGVDPYSSVPYPFLKTKKPADHETLDDEQEEEEEDAPEIETLPLFPMHGEDGMVKPEPDGYYSSGWYRPHNGGSGSRASLELSLNSCMTGRPTGSH